MSLAEIEAEKKKNAEIAELDPRTRLECNFLAKKMEYELYHSILVEKYEHLKKEIFHPKKSVLKPHPNSAFVPMKKPRQKNRNAYSKYMITVPNLTELYCDEKFLDDDNKENQEPYK